MIHENSPSDEKIKPVIDFVAGLASVLSGHVPSARAISMKEIVDFTRVTKIGDCARVVNTFMERNKTAADVGPQSFSA